MTFSRRAPPQEGPSLHGATSRPGAAPSDSNMGMLLSFIGATVVGSVGWWLGERVGFMTAFMLSMVGTGIGMYAGRKAARYYFD